MRYIRNIRTIKSFLVKCLRNHFDHHLSPVTACPYEELEGTMHRSEDVAAVMDEGPSHEELVLEGSYIDLYDPQLPVCQGLRIAPGTQKLLYDLSCRPRGAAILAEAGRSYPVRTRKGQLSYLNKGPEGTQNRSRISLPERPQSVDVSAPFRWDWDPASRTLLLEYPCRPDGVNVSITY